MKVRSPGLSVVICDVSMSQSILLKDDERDPCPASKVIVVVLLYQGTVTVIFIVSYITPVPST